MTVRTTTYAKARAELAKLCGSVADEREIVIIRQRGKKQVAMIAADELASLLEAAHLMRSPKNAKRLLAAYQRAMIQTAKPQTVEELRRELGLD